MAGDTTECEPQTLTAGDTWAWSRPDLAQAWPQADGWSLSYHLSPEAGGSVQTIAATAFAVTVAPAQSSLFAPGRWAWAATVGDGSSRHSVGAGYLEIRPDPASATAADGRSVNARILAAIDATLDKRATADADAFTIEGRSISRTPMDVLLKARALFAELVRRERGGATIATTRVQFT